MKASRDDTGLAILRTLEERGTPLKGLGGGLSLNCGSNRYTKDGSVGYNPCHLRTVVQKMVVVHDSWASISSSVSR